MLMEQLEYNLLFRWWVGLSANEPVWHPTAFTKNRDRLLEGVVTEQFFSLIVQQARAKKLPSDEHFTVDGTLNRSLGRVFSVRRAITTSLNPPTPRNPGNNPTMNWRKEKRKNDTHESLTDPCAQLFKKTRGSEANLA
ncbi:MAG: transposase, family, partial [Bryobacterales bacterium]|nr:transposase, family [Bryobacterales bacterium]